MKLSGVELQTFYLSEGLRFSIEQGRTFRQGNNRRCGFLPVIGIICTLHFWSCSPTDPENREIPVPPPGMVLIKASGRSFRQGADGPSSRADERPSFPSTFAHDYHIDTVEVTIAEYGRVMGRIPQQYDSIGTYDPLWPVCFITWFDAALYCNQRGRYEGLDTVYAYSGIESTGGGNVIRLKALTTDLRVRGYRLPTEAEWEFAAHAGSEGAYIWGDIPDSVESVKYGWYAANSNGSPHPVGQLKKNGYGLYDMAGNAMEWVNDFLGAYPSVPVVDFIGASESRGEYRPVKSGSFRQSMGRLRIPNRSDDYETISSTAVSHIGFRCAVGSIENGMVSGNWGVAARMPKVDMVISDLRHIISTNRARLVFVNHDGNRRVLCFVDYSLPDPKVVQFLDSTNVYVPSISPDGNYAAYATRNDGASSGSSIHVRPLSPVNSFPVKLPDEPAFSPRWWVEPSSKDTFILYTNSAVVNSDPSWPGTMTKMQRIAGGIASGPPQVIEPEGGYHDGRSKDGSYLASGFDLLRMKNLLTFERRVLFTGPQNGKAAGDTSQVCNVSTSPGSQDPAEVMFLDFGYSGESTVTGRRYGVHEFLFICNFNNVSRKWFAAPDGFVWSDPEWSNHPEFAAAGLEAPNGSHVSIGVLNLKQDIFSELLRGSDLLFPALWVGDPDSVELMDLAIDSAGWYNKPPLNYAQSVISWKLSLFWKCHREADIFFTGSSRCLHGIVPSEFTRYKALNLGASSTGLLSALEIIRNYVLIQCGDAKLIGLELMLDHLKFPDGDHSWLSGVAKSKGFLYDRSHGFWKEGVPPGFSQLVSRAPNMPPGSPDSLRGFMVFENPGGWGGPNPQVEGADWTADLPECIQNLRILDSLGRELGDRGIHLMVVVMPQSPYFREIGYFGKYGPTLQAGNEIIDSLRAMERGNRFFHLFDAHRNGLHDFTDADARDSDHLSETGARKISRRLDSLINSILEEPLP